jgi:hypothetical protein
VRLGHWEWESLAERAECAEKGEALAGGESSRMGIRTLPWADLGTRTLGELSFESFGGEHGATDPWSRPCALSEGSAGVAGECRS